MNKWYLIFNAKDTNGKFSRFGVECESKDKALSLVDVVQSKYNVMYSRVCCHPVMSNLNMVDLNSKCLLPLR